MLHHDRHVADQDRGIVRVARHGLGILEIVEAQMQRAPRTQFRDIGAGRLAVGEVDRDLHPRRPVAGIQNAGRLVRDEFALMRDAARWNIALRDDPDALADMHVRSFYR